MYCVPSVVCLSYVTCVFWLKRTYMTRRLSITGCAVSQHCCNDDQQSQWENGEFDPCRSETPENFITKIGHIDYVAAGNTRAKFYGNRPRGVRPTNSQNITSCDFVYLPFPFLSFLPCSIPSLPNYAKFRENWTSW